MRAGFLLLVLAALLAGCASDPRIRVQRIAGGSYLVGSDRCSVLERQELENDIARRAAELCPAGYALPQGFEQRPSRQGSLFGECPRSGALQARVSCLPPSVPR